MRVLMLLLLLAPTAALAQSPLCVGYALRKTVRHLSHPTSMRYARLMTYAARRNKINVGWVAARTYCESNFRNVISIKFGCKWRKVVRYRKPIYYCRRSWGLMQPEVTPVSNPQFLGRERALLKPGLNFQVGTKILAYWKRRHETGRCKCKAAWWWHYVYGYIVPKSKHKAPAKGWKMERYKAKFDKWVKRCEKKRKSR